MTEQGGGDKVVGMMKLIIIACAVIFSITWIPGMVRDHKDNAERKARYERWEQNGISPVTRGMGSRDTVRQDTVNKCP